MLNDVGVLLDDFCPGPGLGLALERPAERATLVTLSGRSEEQS
jgi:hypothetical protein